MSDTNVGRLLFDKGQRDAIHVAIAPVTAIEPLEPGQHIGLTGNQDHVCSNARVLIGVVDPFLKRTVCVGEKFYMFLYPKTVTGMRHHWDHPSFSENTIYPENDMINHHEKWLRDYADEIEIDLAVLMDAARKFIEHGQFLCDGGKLEGIGTKDEFWFHYNALKGTTGEGNFFTCSC